MRMLKIRAMQLLVLVKYYLTVLFVIVFRKKEKNVWLISERGDEARDNGFAFFEYMRKEHKEIDARFVISKNSHDFKKVEKYGDKIIYYRSWKHMYYFILAKYLISTHNMGFSPEFRSMTKLNENKLVYCKGKKIFLQHGITKDDLPILYYDKTGMDLFICGAKKEYDYVSSRFGYPKGLVQYTGFSRYDNLANEPNKTILLMPTWRQNFYKMSDEEFEKTEYFKRYNSLINNKKLNGILEKYGYKMIFYPHYEIQKRIGLFETSCKNVVIAKMENYSVPDLLRQNSLMITDFSSVYFDQAYLGKPVIYYHFDYDNYRNGHYGEGYFSYKRDGFGPIVGEEEELIRRIGRYFENGFKVEEKYKRRVGEFFWYQDKNNSGRIYEAIMGLEEK